MNPSMLLNTLLLTLVTTLLASALGVLVALALVSASRPVRRLWTVAAVLTLMLPPFWVAGQWMQGIGFAGAWRVGGGAGVDRWMPLAASAWVLSLLAWPWAALGLAAAWRRTDARLLEAVPELRGLALVRGLLMPIAWRSLGGPMLLIAVLACGQFAVPAVFQAKVWSAETWIQLSTRLDGGLALAQSGIPLALLAGLAWAWHRRFPVWQSGVVSGAAVHEAQLSRRLGTSLRLGVQLAAGAVVLVSLVVPLMAALTEVRVWRELPGALLTSGAAMARSGIYAAMAATVVMVLGSLVAATDWGRRWGGLWLGPWVVPGIFTGMVVAWLAAGPLFGWIQGTAGVVVLALGLRFGGLGWLAAVLARARMDTRWREVLRMQGAGAWATWRHGCWPAGKGGLGVAWYIIYLMCLWDVETLLLVVPPGGDTLSLVIFNLLHYGYATQVSALGILLGALALVPLGVRWGLAAVWRSRRAGVGTAVALTLAMVTGLISGCGRAPGNAATVASLDSALFERVEVLGAKGTGPGFFNKPRSVTVDREDRLYVVDMTGRVQKFDTNGAWLRLWQMPETDKGKAKGMAGLTDGSLLVVEPHYHRVNRFSSEGALLGQWGDHGTNAGQMWFPRAVAVGTNGDCYVSEYGVVERVQRFRIADGQFLGGFGQAGDGAGQFNRAEGVGTDRQGRVYVADSCHHRVQVFTAEGQWLRAHGRAGTGPGEYGYPYDVQVDAEGRQFVCEFGNSRVQVLDAADRVLEILGGAGSRPGQMNSPWSLCLDSRGNLYVADSQNHRVLKFVRRRALQTASAAVGSGWSATETGGLASSRTW
ncbi:MAG: hypothetical protein IT580_11960 [Verrucomicrobiales bacterium]|nr:hypothetical protein [Verrucomicrobiales bacterium]